MFDAYFGHDLLRHYRRHIPGGKKSKIKDKEDFDGGRSKKENHNIWKTEKSSL